MKEKEIVDRENRPQRVGQEPSKFVQESEQSTRSLSAAPIAEIKQA